MVGIGDLSRMTEFSNPSNSQDIYIVTLRKETPLGFDPGCHGVRGNQPPLWCEPIGNFQDIMHGEFNFILNITLSIINSVSY